MKRLAQLGREPWHGYLAPCERCGLIVVHSVRRRAPFHMHRYSKLCRELEAQRHGANPVEVRS